MTADVNVTVDKDKRQIPFLKMTGMNKHRNSTNSAIEAELEKAWVILYH